MIDVENLSEFERAYMKKHRAQINHFADVIINVRLNDNPIMAAKVEALPKMTIDMIFGICALRLSNGPDFYVEDLG